MSSLADLEARVAALEADRADYRAVLTAVGALKVDVGGLTERVGNVETRLENVETRLQNVETRLQNVEIKTDANRESINALSQKLAGFQKETRDRFDRMDRRMDGFDLRFRSIDEQLSDIKQLIIERLGPR